MAFHDVRLPEDIERGAKGGPLFKTTVLGSISGQEQRNQDWQFARAKWDIGYGMQSRDDFMTVLNFFYARRGRAHAFRFKDWIDYVSGMGFSMESWENPDNRSLLGLGDGAEIDFQLVKHYEDDASDYSRIITRPVNSTIRVWKNDVLQTLTTHYTIQPLGVIRFVSAPAENDVIEAFYEFDVPVRFDQDELSVELEWWNAGQVPDISIIEIRE